MRIKCDYCDNYIDDADVYCPECGAPNEHLMRSADGVPKTIAELKAFCEAHGLPLEKMRFFIGINYTQPRAFGIYRDESGNFIVYKNKADGTRAVRYRGTDEAYAVNEIYQKLKSEISLRKSNTSPKKTVSGRRKRKRRRILSVYITMIIIFIACSVIANLITSSKPSRGYYSYGGGYYYYQDNAWYYYNDDEESWEHAYDVDDELTENYDDYYESGGYYADYGTGDFEDTAYYHETDWEDDWDDDDDWDWGGDDWDTGGTDWDTDWVRLNRLDLR